MKLGELAEEVKFTYALPNDYLKRFKVENMEMCKGLKMLTGNVEDVWYL